MEPKKRGGKRAGAGRPKGSLRGRRAVMKSITMTEQQWELLDRQRGAMSRGKFIAKKI